jgi:5-methylcytosine-specific restriction endonuclease McrA
LRRDGYRCRNCWIPVGWSNSIVDHVRPVHKFASFSQANTLDNVQTLCLGCHGCKTRSERSQSCRR